MSASNRRAPGPPLWKRPVVAILIACSLVVAIGAGVALASGNPFAKYPPAKAAILQREQNAVATAQAQPRAPKNPNYVAPAASTPHPTETAGITNGQNAGPFSACELLVQNTWQGPVNGRWEVVYAGATHHDLAACNDPQGALVIFDRSTAAQIGWYTAPAGAKSLAITSVNDEVMTLRTDTGATLTFNLATNTFSSGG